MKKVSKNKVGKAVAVGAAAALAGAAAYALVGPNGKKNRDKVKKVMVDIKNKVTDNKEVQRVAGQVKKAIGGVKSNVSSASKATKTAVKKAVGGAKASAKKAVAKTKSAVKKVTKTAANKAVKKATK